MRKLVLLAMVALASLLSACGEASSPAEDPVEEVQRRAAQEQAATEEPAGAVDLVLKIETGGGASSMGDIHITGLPSKDIPAAYPDRTFRFKAEPGANVMGTIVRGNSTGELYVTLTADGETVFEDTVNEQNTSANIVLEI